MEHRGVPMMRSLSDCGSSATDGSEEETVNIKKGAWTEEEDSILINYITLHGEGQWNSVARCAGLKRTGKSCRLRWLNYLRPNVRRGNITLQEQLMILDLHLRWGNRWSKIAQNLPGRTDNEIKNYWRTRVLKQAKLLKCDVNSKEFRDALRLVWMPRLQERIRASSSGSMSVHNQAESNSYPCFMQVPSPHCALLDVQTSSLSDSSECYNFTRGGICCDGAIEKGGVESWGIQASEAGNGFGVADFWTEENIWFLQQQLSDEI